jgi:hypothetical protein
MGKARRSGRRIIGVLISGFSACFLGLAIPVLCPFVFVYIATMADGR